MPTDKWFSYENMGLLLSLGLSIIILILSSIILDDTLHPAKCSLDLSIGNLQQDQKFSLGAISVFVSAAEYTILTLEGLSRRPTGNCFNFCQQNEDLHSCKNNLGNNIDFSQCLDSCIICRDHLFISNQNCITLNCTLFGFQ